jgi:protein-disulfide isomerase
MKKNLPKIILALLFLGVIGFVIFAMISPEKSDNSATTANNRPKVSADTAKLSDGNYLGPKDSKVTVVEFGDYQCPACAKYHPVLKNEILPQYDGKIKFVFLNYPLPIHKNGQAASQAAEAAGLQGKFWQMHDLLYEKQAEWEKEKDPTKKFEEYAKQIGIDINQYQQDYASQKVADIINNQAALGDAFNIPGTPTFFVNGVQVNNKNGSDDLKQAIEKALAQ